MGCKPNITEPKELWQWFLEYKEWCKSKPRFENVLHQRSGEVIPVSRERPLTWDSFRIWLIETNKTTTLLKYKYSDGQSDYYKQFKDVIDLIDCVIKSDKFEGATVGIYNYQIIARDLGLTDKQEITEIKEQPLFPDVE